MKLRYILLIISLAIAWNALSMDIGQLYRHTQEEIAKEEAGREAQIPADKVLLISNDGKEFLVPLNLAQQSRTLRSMIEEMPETGRIIPLNEISGTTLNEIVELLTILQQNQNLKGKALLDALEIVKVSNIFTLLSAANYLDVPILLDFTVRKIAQQEASKWKILTTCFKNRTDT